MAKTSPNLLSSAPTPGGNPRGKSCLITILGLLASSLAIFGIYLVFLGSQYSDIVQGIGSVVACVIALIAFFLKGEEVIQWLYKAVSWLFQKVWGLIKWIWQTTNALRIVCAILLVLTIAEAFWLHVSLQSSSYPCQGKGTCVVLIENQPIGISDPQNARFWPGSDEENAEGKIAYDNGSIEREKRKYVTLVVFTTLSPGSQQQRGYDDLRAAAVFQKQVNRACELPSCAKVKVLVANAGDDLQYALQVAQQIVKLKESGEPILGVVGMPTSVQEATDGIRYLTERGILVISSTQSSDSLPTMPLYFKIAPRDSEQGSISADLIKTDLPQVKRVVIFYAPDILYSVTLAESFGKRISQNGVTVLYEKFQRKTSSDQRAIEISNKAEETAKRFPSGSDLLIFCACYSDDLNTLLTSLRSHTYLSTFQDVPVVSGDAAYNLKNNRQNYKDLYYTAFAFPDAWGSIDLKSCPGDSFYKRFFCDYADAYDPKRQHLGEYGYTRASSFTILAYDAMRVLLTAYSVARDKKNAEPNADEIEQALLGDFGCSEFQGVSGRIAFGVDGHAREKTVLMLYVDSNGHAHIKKGAEQSQLWVDAAKQC